MVFKTSKQCLRLLPIVNSKGLKLLHHYDNSAEEVLDECTQVILLHAMMMMTKNKTIDYLSITLDYLRFHR